MDKPRLGKPRLVGLDFAGSRGTERRAARQEPGWRARASR